MIYLTNKIFKSYFDAFIFCYTILKVPLDEDSNCQVGSCSLALTSSKGFFHFYKVKIQIQIDAFVALGLVGAVLSDFENATKNSIPEENDLS